MGHVKVLLGMFLSLKTLYRKRTVIWPFYFYTIIRTLSSYKLYLFVHEQIIYINLSFLLFPNRFYIFLKNDLSIYL
ncbi:hypothetical protein LR49_14425 [Staphylococcus aureus]|nr:hypothetical protein LR49_14425 [Staphylococcus aureus]REL22883.1 hypothetical protein DY400_10040 [Staphylococcus aureus]